MRALRFVVLVLLLLAVSRAYGDIWVKVTVQSLRSLENSGSYDTGTFTVTVNGYSRTAEYGQFSTTASVASALAAKFAADCDGVASARSKDSEITFRVKGQGTTANFSSSERHAAGFSGAAFGLSGTTTYIGTKTVLSGTPNPAAPGSVVSLVATITPDNTSGGALNGSVKFWDNGLEKGTSVVTSGHAILSLTDLDAGTHSIKAVYTGDGSYLTSSSTATWQVISTATAAASNTTLYSYTGLSYDGNNNIVGVNDQIMGSWEFGYDTLHRLTQADASTGPYANQHGCWTYDEYGNRTSESISNVLCSSSPTPAIWAHYADGGNHITATNQYGGAVVYTGPTYDGGNITDDGRFQYAYNGDNQVCAAFDGASNKVIFYVYDGMGSRVATLTGSGTGLPGCNPSNLSSYTLLQQRFSDGSGAEEVVVNGANQLVSADVYAGAQMVTYTLQNGYPVAHYQLADWLGTRRVQVSGLGNVEGSYQSLPFGSTLVSSGQDATQMHFAGLMRDDSTLLEQADFRDYSAAMGRWMTPDPYDGSFDWSDPQSLNRYAYVGGNVLNESDPSGLEGAGFCGIGGSAEGSILGASAPYIAAAGCALDLLLHFWPHHVPFTGSTKPRPSAPDNGPKCNDSAWDETCGYAKIRMRSNPLDALGVPQIACRYGICQVPTAVDPNQIEQHHIFIQELADWFRERGAGDLIKYTTPLTAALHRLRSGPGVHTRAGGNWSRVWREWRAQNPNATRAEILEQGKQMLKNFWQFGADAGSNLPEFLITIDPCMIEPSLSICRGAPPIS